MKMGKILLLVLLLIIGFGAVSTTLIINGNTNIGFNENDFKSNVVFTKAETLTGTAIINGDEKNIDFESIKLENINQTTTLDYSVTNKSREYDASVEIKCGLKDEYKSYEDYLDISMSLTSPFDLIAGETKNGILTVKLKKAYNELLETSVEIKCELIATPVERETLGEEYIPPLYKDKVLNGADPIIKDKLVPVTLADDGIVTYADTSKEWYNYTEKKWANAVILNDGVTHKVGDIIPEGDIESYFVWIPRYRYQIFDEGNYNSIINEKPTKSLAKEIQIRFESKQATPLNGSNKGEWLTHPAFTTLDTAENKLSGIWVGKFETSRNNNRIQIKPNVSSWRNETVKTFFTTMKSYNTNLDSHMMKNTEWGAAAYLSHSVYGINKEVRINNNSNFLTGFAATDGTDQSGYPGTSGTDTSKAQPYNTTVGYKASTTGNITGIYDMSGGTWEYVAGYMTSSSDKSGFTVSEINANSKYLDVYPSNSTIFSYNNRILGDATGEMGPFYNYADAGGGNQHYHNNWYADDSYFVDSTSAVPWFRRGGGYSYGILAGQFTFARNSGGASDSIASRLVLTPTN